MTSSRFLAAGLAAVALAATGGIGYLLLAPAPAAAPLPASPPEPSKTVAGLDPPVPAKAVPGTAGPGRAGPTVVDPTDERDLDGPEGGASTEEILAAAAKGDWKEVEHLRAAGGGSADPRVTDAIAKGLSDDRWRPMVAELAKYLKDPGAAEKFLALAKAEGNEYTRATAIRAAALVGGPGVLEATQEILKSAKPGGLLAGEATAALGLLGTPEAAAVLVGMLRENAGKKGAPAVVEALGHVRSPEALVALGEMLQDPESPAAFRAALAEALGKTRDPAVVNDLLRVVRDAEDEGLRNACYRSLAMVGSPEAVTELLQVVHGADNGRRFEAAAALAGLSNKVSGPLIEEALKSSVDPVLRGYLLTALGRTDRKSVV